MVFRADPNLETIAPEDRIWRYLSIQRFKEIVLSEKLYFRRIDKYSDELEGKVPQVQFEHVRGKLQHAVSRVNLHPKFQELKVRTLMDRMEAVKFARACYAASCWNIGDAETPRLWTEYGKPADMVAIQSTYGRLKIALEDAELPVRIGRVKYINHKNHVEQQWSSDRIAFFKDSARFSFENEIRAVIEDGSGFSSDGITQAVRVQTLIERVVVGPNADAQVRDKAKGLVQSHLRGVLCDDSILS